MNRHHGSDRVREPAAVPLMSKHWLDQVRERIRYMHYSLQTVKACVYWARFFVCWSRAKGGMRHPRELGSAEVEAFLTMLASERQVSPATHHPCVNSWLSRRRCGPVTGPRKWRVSFCPVR